MVVSFSGASVTVVSVLERVQSVEESHVSTRLRTHDHKIGNEYLHGHGCARIAEDFPVNSIRAGVKQVPLSLGNPDALLFLVDAPGIDAVDPHCCADHGALNGSVWTLGVKKRTGRDRRSR